MTDGSSNSDFSLIIKSANQKYPDFTVVNCELDWTVKKLKEHLNQNYPNNPVIITHILIL
jgi:hypothetical protein